MTPSYLKMASYRIASMDCTWRQTVLSRLQERNKKESHSFQALIASHNKFFECADALKAENLHLTVQNERLRIENAEIHCTERSTGRSNEKSMALEMKLFKLQEELTELHRRKGENAQQLIDLKNVLQDKEKEITVKDSRLRISDETIRALSEKQKFLEQKIKELEATNQMLKDEHQALQLAFTGVQDQLRTVQDENRDLVARWMQLKARDADKMNEENEVVLRLPHFIPGLSKKCSKLLRILTPSIKRQNRIKIQKELDEAARDPVTVESSGRPSPVEVLLNFTLPTKVLTKFDAHEGEVQAVKWGPRGRIFATGGADRKVKLWEVIKGNVEPRGVLRGSNAAVTSVDFNSEDDLILGTSNDFASRVWTVADQRLRHTLTGHSGRVLAAKFLGESAKIVSGSHDRTLKIWDLRSLACIRTIFTGSSCNDVVTDRPGTTVISGHFDKRIRFWDIRRDSAANEVVLQGKVTSLDISPDGNHLLSCVRDNTLKLLDLRMNQVICSFHAEGFWVGFDWTRAVFTPDGRYVSAGSQDGTIFIWDVMEINSIKTLKEHTNAVSACAWQSTGSSLASCDRNKQVIIWSAI